MKKSIKIINDLKELGFEEHLQNPGFCWFMIKKINHKWIDNLIVEIKWISDGNVFNPYDEIDGSFLIEVYSSNILIKECNLDMKLIKTICSDNI